MNTTISSPLTVAQVEENIRQLSVTEQLWLMERLAHHIRQTAGNLNSTEQSGQNPVTNGHSHQTKEVHTVGAAITPQPTRSPLADLPIQWTNKKLLMEAMDSALAQLGIRGEAIGAVAARGLMQQEVELEPNELSRGIIDMREEKLRDHSLF